MGRLSVRSIVGMVLVCSTSTALDKQGSAHGGSVGGDDAGGFNVSGSAMFGVSLYNPTYAARPDNSGLALFRYAGHADVDVLGRKLSFPIDVNVFTDRERGGAEVLLPTEFDVIGGVTSTWALGPGAIEVGTRFEHDRPVDQGTYSQTYVDARARYIYSLAPYWDALERNGLDVSGWATLGVFALNPTYAARPDNTGRALLRYGAHTELSLFDDLVSFGIDGVMFTDREVNAVRPSELDITPEAILHAQPFELHLAYERDLPLDRAGRTQTYAYALAVWSFDLRHEAAAPLENRGHIVSP